MGLVNFSSFTPLVVALMGTAAPDPVVTEALIRDAAIEFCTRTGAWSERVDVDLQAGVSEYPIEPPDCAQLVRVTKVCNGCMELKPVTGKFCRLPCGRFVVEDGWIRFSPAPAQDHEGGLQVYMTLKPSRDGCQVGEVVYEDWASAITEGVMARLYQQKGQPWANALLAKQSKILFEHRMHDARVASIRGKSSGPMMIKTARF